MWGGCRCGEDVGVGGCVCVWGDVGVGVCMCVGGM